MTRKVLSTTLNAQVGPELHLVNEWCHWLPLVYYWVLERWDYTTLEKCVASHLQRHGTTNSNHIPRVTKELITHAINIDNRIDISTIHEVSIENSRLWVVYEEEVYDE